MCADSPPVIDDREVARLAGQCNRAQRGRRHLPLALPQAAHHEGQRVSAQRVCVVGQAVGAVHGSWYRAVGAAHLG